MKKGVVDITIRTDGYEAYVKRSLERARKLSAGQRIKPEKTITFETPESFFRILTRERIRLCQVTREESLSISALAAKLKRDTSSVRKDIAVLEKVGLIKTFVANNPGHGKAKFVEPVARRVNLKAAF